MSLEKIKQGELDYDRQTMRRQILRILTRNQSTGILSTFDGDSKQYVRISTERVDGIGNERIHRDSKDGVAREGLPLRDKPSFQESDELLKDRGLTPVSLER